MFTDTERQTLKDQIMAADLANKNADTALKDEQKRWEPWKALSAAFGAGVAVTLGLVTLISWFLTHALPR